MRVSRIVPFVVVLSFTTGVDLHVQAAAFEDEYYPSRQLRLVIPFTPQSSNDIVGRIVAQGLQESLLQIVQVDNRGGVGGTLGASLVAKAPPDGYTVMSTNISLAINATLFSGLPYDALKDFAPISVYGREAYVLVIHPGIRATSVAELLKLARAMPGGLIYGSAGNGTGSHLAVEVLQLATKATMTHVPYQGSGDALNGITIGKMEMGILPQSSALPFTRLRKVTALAVTSTKRAPLFPQVPTMIEEGIPEYEFNAWYVLSAPSKTPTPIIARLNGAMERITQSVSVKAQFAAQGVESTHTTPEQALVYVRSEIERWSNVVKASGAHADFVMPYKTTTVIADGPNLPGVAREYPSRELRLIVPFPPGGANDVLAKIIGKKLHEFLGKAVAIDNRGGAGSTTGTGIVAKAPPDGHTLLLNNISLATSATLFPNLPYDTLRDLMPLSIVGRQPNVLVVGPSVKANTVQDLLNVARTKAGKLIYGSGGLGSSSHLAGERLKLATNVAMAHVPYKGLGPAMTDLVAGKNDFIIATMSTALPVVKAGKVRALAVATAKRTPFFPDTPTMMEAGIPDYEVSTWYSMLAPAKTPAPVVKRLNNELAKVAASENVKAQLMEQGVETGHTTPEQALAYIRSEIEKWGRVIRAVGVNEI